MTVIVIVIVLGIRIRIGIGISSAIFRWRDRDFQIFDIRIIEIEIILIRFDCDWDSRRSDLIRSVVVPAVVPVRGRVENGVKGLYGGSSTLTIVFIIGV